MCVCLCVYHGQVWELSDTALDFFVRKFRSVDEDGDQVISWQQLDALFSTIPPEPVAPWQVCMAGHRPHGSGSRETQPQGSRIASLEVESKVQQTGLNHNAASRTGAGLQAASDAGHFRLPRSTAQVYAERSRRRATGREAIRACVCVCECV